jgi:hypothetical protein
MTNTSSTPNSEVVLATAIADVSKSFFGGQTVDWANLRSMAYIRQVEALLGENIFEDGGLVPNPSIVDIGVREGAIPVDVDPVIASAFPRVFKIEEGANGLTTVSRKQTTASRYRSSETSQTGRVVFGLLEGLGVRIVSLHPKHKGVLRILGCEQPYNSLDRYHVINSSLLFELSLPGTDPAQVTLKDIDSAIRGMWKLNPPVSVGVLNDHEGMGPSYNSSVNREWLLRAGGEVLDALEEISA